MLTEENKTEYRSLDIIVLNDRFLRRCKDGDLEHLKYLLTSKELKYNVHIRMHGNEAVMIACQNKYNDIVKYLTSSKELKEHINIHQQQNRLLKLAASNDNQELVSYLLTSPELEEHALLYCDNKNDTVLKIFAKRRNLEGIRFLLTTPSIKEKVDFNENNEEIFKLLWQMNHSTMKIMEMLFLEVGINITKEMRFHVENYSNKQEPEYSEMLKIFEKRDLANKLNNDLQTKNSSCQRTKI